MIPAKTLKQMPQFNLCLTSHSTPYNNHISLSLSHSISHYICIFLCHINNNTYLPFIIMHTYVTLMEVCHNNSSICHIHAIFSPKCMHSYLSYQTCSLVKLLHSYLLHYGNLSSNINKFFQVNALFFPTLLHWTCHFDAIHVTLMDSCMSH